VTLHRIPHVRDIRTMQRLLVDVGARVDIEDGVVRLEASKIVSPEAPYELVKTMRASSLVLARWWRARDGLVCRCRRLRYRRASHQPAHFRSGTTRRAHPQSHGYIEAVAPEGLRGATCISTASPSPAPKT